MGQFNDISTIRSRPGLQFFYKERAIFILPASQVERLSVSKDPSLYLSSTFAEC